MKRSAPTIGWFSLLASGTVRAAEPGSKLADPVAYLGDIAGSLLLIVALIVIAGWLLKRFGKLSRFQPGNQAIKIVSSTSIGTRERLALVDVGGEQFIVGIAPGRIEKVHTMQSPLAVEQADEHRVGFSELLLEGRFGKGERS